MDGLTFVDIAKDYRTTALESAAAGDLGNLMASEEESRPEDRFPHKLFADSDEAIPEQGIKKAADISAETWSRFRKRDPVLRMGRDRQAVGVKKVANDEIMGVDGSVGEGSSVAIVLVDKHATKGPIRSFKESRDLNPDRRLPGRMGNAQTYQVGDDVPPASLSERSIEAVADYINNKNVRKVVFMVGAGMSTASGIPDFRSPGTGLYHNLRKLGLPHPEALFELSYFKENPQPFYNITREIQADQCRPTFTHVLIAEFYKRGMLEMCFTQNIDALERKAGIPADKLVEAHGSYATQSCTICGASYPDDLMAVHVVEQRVPICLETNCGGYVKPDIVFFGQSLPDRFFNSRSLPATADLGIVIGSSLSVQPFAHLPDLISQEIPRVLLNNQIVGSFGRRPDDVIFEGTCDGGARALAMALGWHDDVEREWLRLAGEAEAKKQMKRNEESRARMQVAKERKALIRYSTSDAESDLDEHEYAEEVDKLVEPLVEQVAAAHVSPVFESNPFNPAKMPEKIPNAPVQRPTLCSFASGANTLSIGGVSVQLDTPTGTSTPSANEASSSNATQNGCMTTPPGESTATSSQQGPSPSKRFREVEDSISPNSEHEHGGNSGQDDDSDSEVYSDAREIIDAQEDEVADDGAAVDAVNLDERQYVDLLIQDEPENATQHDPQPDISMESDPGGGEAGHANEEELGNIVGAGELNPIEHVQEQQGMLLGNVPEIDGGGHADEQVPVDSELDDENYMHAAGHHGQPDAFMENGVENEAPQAHLLSEVFHKQQQQPEVVSLLDDSDDEQDHHTAGGSQEVIVLDDSDDSDDSNEWEDDIGAYPGGIYLTGDLVAVGAVNEEYANILRANDPILIDDGDSDDKTVAEDEDGHDQQAHQSRPLHAPACRPVVQVGSLDQPFLLDSDSD
ncbi:hypothetical protein MKZ38_010163 [Zalerion maritima]|uniref:Deacetylase sirtuin-type domain-containing protein n=1 Tax=Zalerion maritima TaxID=339359 RepID=A0AAD5RUH0_9PEZI|nr:hypothetical protein MKZ38_010163 [Zalerion maritima]